MWRIRAKSWPTSKTTSTHWSMIKLDIHNYGTLKMNMITLYQVAAVMEEQPGILDQGRLLNRPGRGRSSLCMDVVVVVVVVFRPDQTKRIPTPRSNVHTNMMYGYTQERVVVVFVVFVVMYKRCMIMPVSFTHLRAHET